MQRKLALTTVVLTSFTVALALVAALPAGAKAPAKNGLIAFVRSDFNTGVDTTYIVNPDGTHPKPLTVGSNPHWSPDGTQLAIATPYNGGCPPCASTTILNPDTGQTRVLKPPDPSAASTCTLWSPDATRFACGLEDDQDPGVNGIYTIRTSDGRGLARITDPGPMIDIPIDYSPDGKQIVFGRQQPSGCTTTSALYVVNIDGSQLHRITPGGFCDDDGSWSPNGGAIAFEHHGALFVVHPNGTGLKQIPLATDSRAFAGDYSWSPSGTKISFLLVTPIEPPSGGPTSSFQVGIATANADGSNVQQITTAPDGEFDHEGDWGPHPLLK